MVNQTFAASPLIYGGACPALAQAVAPKHHFAPIVGEVTGILLTVQACPRFLARAGRNTVCESIGMIETVSALMGLVSAGIFLAHAFEGYRTRA